MKELSNRHANRESWLDSALNDLRGYFAAEGLTVPDAVRIAIGFPSTGRKNKTVGETWDNSTSADGTYEIFIRPDISDPVEVLSILTAKTIHTVIPPLSGHGKLYRKAAMKLGLQGKMTAPEPGTLLLAKLQTLASSLGPLPHASLNIENGPGIRRPVDVKKKQGTRLRKSVCEVDGCGYTVRIASKWVNDLGPPHCPRHGAMGVEQPDESEKIDSPDGDSQSQETTA